MNYMAKRCLLILCVMFPTLLIAQMFNYNTTAVSALAAGLSSGMSVIFFPDPEHLKRMAEKQIDKLKEEQKELEK